MSQWTSCATGHGVTRAIGAFLTVAAVISFSPVVVQANDTMGYSARQGSDRVFSSDALPRFLAIPDPLFGFPVCLQNLTWGNFKDTGEIEVATLNNLTWGNFTTVETEISLEPQ